MRQVLGIAILSFVSFLFVPSAAADPEAWAGQVWEHDEYVAANPISTLHTSCDSKVGLAVLVHETGGWHFAAADDDCIGSNADFTDAECLRDLDDVVTCTHTDGYGSEYVMSVTPAGHVTSDYDSHAGFEGDHYHVEGDLVRAA